MIRTLSDLHNYIRSDQAALGYGRMVYPLILSEAGGIKLFLLLLRTCEYLRNNRLYLLFLPLRILYRRVALSLGFSIPLNVCGPGLALPHLGPVIINGQAVIGANVRIHSCVVIGGTSEGAPHIGDNCYIGPGAKLYGKISIGNNVRIGANSVVNKDFPSNCFIGGVPAKVIKQWRL